MDKQQRLTNYIARVETCIANTEALIESLHHQRAAANSVLDVLSISGEIKAQRAHLRVLQEDLNRAVKQVR